MSPGPRRDPPLDAEERKRIVEAILFVHDGPVTIEMLAESLAAEDPAKIRQAIAELGRDYDSNGQSFEIVRIAGGYQICTRERWANWVARFQRGSRRVRLSRAAVETLAIVAYRQPITRTQIEEVRGVDCGGVLHTLLERTLVTVKGRSRGIGRPLLYATTSEFLEYFGLDRLEDLPRLDEIESLLKDREELVEEVIGSEGDGLRAASPEDGAQLDGDQVDDCEESDDGLGDVERAAVLATDADPEDDSDDDSGERV
jgi:segregation and condensation protein B